MKRTAFKILSAVLVFALLAALVPTSVFAEQVDSGVIDVGVLSDIHYFAPENIDDPVKCAEVCNKTISTTYLADSILATALATFRQKAEAGKLDYLLVPGDLSKNGDLVSLTKLAEILEKFENETGVQVLVANGNHDINNHRADVFRDGQFRNENTPVNAAKFRELYENLGYDLAVEEFTPPTGEEAGGLSYVAQLSNGYRVIMIDGGKYSPDNSATNSYAQETAGKYSDAVLNWAVEQTEIASQDGYTVIGMTHWSLVPHFSKELNTFKDFCIVDCDYVSERLANAGMNYVFTGHLHVQDIAQHVTDEGNILYDVATSSVLSYPNYVRTVEFDNTGDGLVKADIKTADFDEAQPLVYSGTTYPQPFRQTSFGINFTGDSAYDMVMGMASYYIEDVYLPQISQAGGLYNFLLDSFDLQGVFDDLLGGGVKLGSLTVFSSKNIMGLIKDLCAQVDKAYINDPDRVMEIVSDLVKELIGFKISDVPCTKFIDTYGFGDSTKGGTLGDMVSSVLVYMYEGNQNISDDEFINDVITRLDTGEVSTELMNKLIDILLDGFIQGELFGTLRLNISAAFPKGTFGSLLVKGLDAILRVVLFGNNTFSNVVKFGFKVVNALGIVEYTGINDILNHVMDEYLTTSQMEMVDGEIQSFLVSFCVDTNPGLLMDLNATLTANTAGGYAVEKTADNMRLPSNVAVTLGNNSATSRIISWYTKLTVTGTDFQITTKADYDLNGFTSTNTVPAGASASTDTVKTLRQYPGVDLGVMGILPYSFNLNRHTVVFNGLQPGTTYCYRVGDAAKGFWSEPATIRTADNSDEVTFIHTSDCQSGLEKQYQNWAKVLDTAYSMFDADFIVSTGDQVDNGDNFRQWQWMFNSAADTLMSTAFMPTAGNHEEKGTNAITDNFALKTYPQQNTEEGVYYSFDYNNVHFMILNSNNLNDSEGLSDDQIAWLTADAKASTAQWKIVALHKAVYSNGSHYDDKDVIAIRAQLATLMPQLGIDIVLQGHDHVYLRTDAMNQNQVVDVYETTETFGGNSYTAKVNPDGTIYVIDACSGVKYYQTKSDAETDKLFPRAEKIVNATTPVFGAFRIVGSKLYFDAYSVNPETGATARIDSFEIVKDPSIDTPKFDGGKPSIFRELFGTK